MQRGGQGQPASVVSAGQGGLIGGGGRWRGHPRALRITGHSVRRRVAGRGHVAQGKGWSRPQGQGTEGQPLAIGLLRVPTGHSITGRGKRPGKLGGHAAALSPGAGKRSFGVTFPPVTSLILIAVRIDGGFEPLRMRVMVDRLTPTSGANCSSFMPVILKYSVRVMPTMCIR